MNFIISEDLSLTSLIGAAEAGPPLVRRSAKTVSFSISGGLHAQISPYCVVLCIKINGLLRVADYLIISVSRKTQVRSHWLEFK